MCNCIENFYEYDLVKKCRVCENFLLKSIFYKNKAKRDGYRSGCVSCSKEHFYKNRHR